jgi:phage shock protein PspC (stress-responsive transcriptional regulator)
MNPCKKCLVKAMCTDTCDDFLKYTNKIKDIQSFIKDFIGWCSAIIWILGVPFGISMYLNVNFFVVFTIWIVFNAATFALALITQHDW